MYTDLELTFLRAVCVYRTSAGEKYKFSSATKKMNFDQSPESNLNVVPGNAFSRATECIL